MRKIFTNANAEKNNNQIFEKWVIALDAPINNKARFYYIEKKNIIRIPRQ